MMDAPNPPVHSNRPAQSSVGAGRVIALVFVFILACAAINAAYFYVRLRTSVPAQAAQATVPVEESTANQVEAPQTHPDIDMAAPVVLQAFSAKSINSELEAIGFSCGETERGMSGYFQSRCERSDGQGVTEVYHFGRTAESIDLIDINLTLDNPPNDDAVLAWLDEIMSCLGVDSRAEVLGWAEQILPQIVENRDIRETNIAGIKYRLYGAPANRSLEIGWLP